MKPSILMTALIAISAASTIPTTVLAQGLPPMVKQKVDATQKQVKTIGMEEYRKIVENPGSALIVDVREPQEYVAGHVPGAINIPRGAIESEIWNHVGAPDKADMQRPIVLQCQAGRRASLAAQSLENLGFTHTTAVAMSLDDWQKAGNPFVK
jgi:rhodanese-related sulfurtransferase